MRAADPAPRAVAVRRLAAGADDAPGLARLEAASFADPWSVADLGPYLASGAVAAFVAHAPPAAPRPCGYALFQLLPGEVELLRIGVEPGSRGRGVARELLAGALAELAAGGRPVCHLEVHADNAPARALYARCGFVVGGRRRGYYADGGDALRYVRGAAAGPPARDGGG